MSNRELIDATVRAARNERCATVALLALLGELDERKLYLGEGCSSLFTYCTHHVLPFAHGGPPSVSNISLRCRAHNSFESEAIFGYGQKADHELRPDQVG